MKHTALALAILLASAPAYAQLGGLDRLRKGAEQAKKVADINISASDERRIGEAVSAKLIDAFGIYQDPAVARYVSLVGKVLAEGSSRSGLDWKFIVLDSEGVNAYAAPGGIVHITKGALGLIKSEAELAGVLAHEISHITAKHTIRAIQKAKLVDAGTDVAGSSQGGLAGAVVNRLADVGYDVLFENKFDRDDETEADNAGVAFANKAGYSPTGLNEFLTHLTARNKAVQARNGLFASHPETKDRLERISRTIKAEKLTASAAVQPRYAKTITFDAKPLVAVTVVERGTRGVAGGGSTAKAEPEKKDEKKEEPKRRGFGVGRIASSLSGGSQAESTQASGSGGGRMVGPDNLARGGGNKTPVKVTITAADVAAFKKGIA